MFSATEKQVNTRQFEKQKILQYICKLVLIDKV